MPWVSGVIIGIQILMGLLEVVDKATDQVEKISPQGSGPENKKKMAGDIVRTAVRVADRFTPDGEFLTDEQKDAVVGVIDETIDTVVAAKNAAGIFHKVV